MARHALKAWSEPFQAMWDGLKRFEFRKNDRNYRMDDTLILREYDPEGDSYSGREIRAAVAYIAYGGRFGIPEDHCIMDLQWLGRVSVANKPGEEPNLSKCPGCGGPADQGHSRDDDPSAYYCTKCEG